MKRLFIYLIVSMLCVKQSFALISITVTGNTNTVPTLASTYVSLSSAIAALNSVTAINGPVTFNMNSGTTESATTQYLITQAGSTLYPITFQKTGSTANPKLTRTDAGTNTTTGNGGFGDGVLRVDGTDNIHFNGLDIAASNSGIEYGYYIHKPNATNGSQTLSIKNATITMTKGTSAFVIGIYVDNGQTSLGVSDGLTLTASTGQHSNFTITGNTIQNVHKGILCYGYYGNYLSPYYYDRDFTIGQNGAGNTIQNFGGGVASESAGISCNYIINLNINYNTIANMAGGGVAHGSILYGLDIYGSTGNCKFNNNTITLNNTSGEVDWISNYTFGFSLQIPGKNVEINNNQFAGSVGSSSGSYLIYSSVNGSGSHFSARNNITSGTIAMSGVSGTLYGYYHYGNTDQREEVVSNNFSNLVAPNTCYGIYSSGGNNDTTFIDSNIVSNLSTTSTLSGTLYGIYNLNSTRCYVRDNLVNSLSGNSVTGIVFNYSSNKPNTEVYRNKIYGLNSTTTSTNSLVASGIYVYDYDEPGSIKLYNNLIGLITAPTSSGLNAVNGIRTSSFSLSDILTLDVAHNTIYLNASSSTVSNFGSSGIFHSSSTSLNEQILLRNNIVVNTSIAKGTGVTAALRRDNTIDRNIHPLSNRNLYFVGTPSANQVIFTNGTTSQTTLSNYQNYIATISPSAERNSVSENITFQSLIGNTSNFLKFDTSIPNLIESGGNKINAVDGDYSKALRAGDAGYAGSGYAPDLGAWELDGISSNLCTGTPTFPTAMISNVNPCSDSLFSVYVDQVYGSGITYQWQESLIDSVSGFTSIPNANESYYVTSTNQDKWYRCVVTCLNGNQSIQSSAVMVNVTPLSGTYVISNTGSGNYISIAAAIADLVCRSTSGPVVFELVDGQVFTETSNLSIRYNGLYPITFKKQGNGANPIIRRAGTSTTTNYILELVGADQITFDGIDFEQTGTAASSYVEFGIHITNNGATNGAQHNTFKNGTITLTNASINTIGVNCHSTLPYATNAAGANSYNRFVNMTVQSAFKGYQFDNLSTVVLDQGNEVVGEGGLRGNINSLGSTTLSATVYGIYASEQRNFKVDSIDIVGLQNSTVIYGIYSENTDSSIQQFSNNHIQFLTSGNSIRTIALYYLKNVKVFNNEINDINCSSTTFGNVTGLQNTSCSDSAFIFNNKIYNMSTTGTSSAWVYGMSIDASAYQLVYNNMISDLRAGSATNYPVSVAGLHTDVGSGGTMKFYNNSIYLTNIGTSTSFASAGICSEDSTFTFDLRNNLILNKSNVTTGSMAVALYKYYHTPDKISSTSNNNIWYAGIPDAKHFIYYATTPSTNAQTLTQFKALATIAPAEGESFTENTTIVASLLGEIRPSTSIPNLVEGRAQPISFITTDFESDPRHPSTPDIGADEGPFVANLTADCPTLISPMNNTTGICPFEVIKLTWDLPASLRTITGGYDIYFGTSSTPPFIANTNNLFYTLPALQGNTTYYWKIVAKYASGDAVGCDIRSFTTSSAGIVSVNNGQRCGPGIVNLSVNGLGTIQWFTSAASTTPFQTGTTYNPNLSASTNYYVSSINGYGLYSYKAGKPALGTPSSAGTSATEYESFNVLSACIIDSVVVYPSTSGNVILNLANSSGTVLLTATKAVTAAQVGTAVTMFVNWPVSVGTGYRIYKPATSVGLLRNTTGAVYPYTLAGILSVTSSTAGTTAYSWAYNWTVRPACESPKQLITATIQSSTSTKSTISACNSYTWALSGLTYTSSGIYTHTSIPASGCLQTDSLVLTIGVSGGNAPINQTACGSYTWNLNGQTYTNSGVYTATFLNSNGCDSSYQLNLTIQSCISNLQATLYLQGYYNGGGFMVPTLMNQGIGSDANLVDFITIELRDTSTYAVVASNNVLLQTDGTTNSNFAITPGYYYIVVKHRNTLETWSATPISFGSSTTVYNFTNSSSKAYGNNMIEVEPGKWAFYTSDLNNDANIDLLDLALTEFDLLNLLYGYYSTDLNGDGNVDLVDMPIIENNMNNFISTSKP